MKSTASTQDFSDEGVAASKAVVSSLLLALKVLPLYPEDHTNCKRAMSRLQDDLGAFFSEYQEIVFHVEKGCIFFEDEVVHKGEAKDGDLGFILSRDGILNLVIQQGIESQELNEFVKILGKYRNLPDEAEGDIVTALWEAQLPHIRYDAADTISETDLEDGLSYSEKNSSRLQQLKPSKETDSSTSMESRGDAGASQDASQKEDDEIKDLPLVDVPSLQLTNDEAENLQAVVRREKEWDATQEILNVMVDILQDQKKEEFFNVALEYISEELRVALGRQNFDLSLRILIRLHKIRQLCKESRSWALSMINKFFLRAAGPDFLSVLQDVWPTLRTSEIEKAKKVLLLLPPKAGGSLGSMLLESLSPSVQKMLTDVIVSLASRDFKPIDKLLEKAEEELLHRLVPLMGLIESEESAKSLVKMAHHPTERIRHEALRVIIARDLWVPEKITSLMDDKSNPVRQLFIKHLGSRRSEVAEGILLDYLQNLTLRNRDSEHLSDCFKALGRCGSVRSIPFLRETLLSGSLISRLHPTARRQAAAIALAELGTKKAKQALEEGSQSRFPGIRSAALAVI